MVSRPRILIADTDINYIIPLQLKFAEEFYDNIELFIITDRNYFKEFFSSPNNTDIIIVSEELFDKSILRQNAKKIFIMSEQSDILPDEESNIIHIYKYTNIQGIFNEIIGKSREVFESVTENENITQIIVVYSGAGGVGKTTVSLGMSACLSEKYKKVLYISAQHLQNIQNYMSDPRPLTNPGTYEILLSGSDNLYYDLKTEIRKDIFYYLPPFKASLSSIGVPFSVFGQIAVSAKNSNDYDYIIIDTDTVFDDDKARLLNIADKVILLTKQNIASVMATNNLVSNMNGMSTDKYIFLCNDFREGSINALTMSELPTSINISDYIEHIKSYDRLQISDFTKIDGIQKAAMLVM